jgi:hypothetical protein
LDREGGRYTHIPMEEDVGEAAVPEKRPFVKEKEKEKPSMT